MMSVYGCETKKVLKSKIGEPADSVLMDTSLFGSELRDDCRVTVVGPAPLIRKWYATVTVVAGNIAGVK